MTQINEVSRLSQLTPAGIAKLSDGMREHKLSFYSITKEIDSKIAELSPEAYADGIEWYREANYFATEMADTYDVTIAQAAGVIAAVSPRMAWLRNKAVAEQILFRFRNFDENLSALEVAAKLELGMHSNIAMAIKIARGEDISNILTGTKRRSFYNNIVSPNAGDSVTVDTWMVRAIMNTTNVDLKTASDLLRINRVALGGTGAGYYVIAESVRNVAKRLGINPCQAQALYWISQAGSANGGR